MRLQLTEGLGPVAIRQQGAVARVTLPGVRLGSAFAGRHFAWTATPEEARAQAPTPRRLVLVASESEVSVEVELPAEATLELRREPRRVWLVVHRAPPPAPRVFAAFAQRDDPAPSRAESSEPPRREPAPVSPPEEPREPAPEPPGNANEDEDVTALARALFPSSSAGGGDDAEGIAELYARLFPSGRPEAREPAQPVDAPVPGGLSLGPFRLQASLAARYVDADTFLGPTPTRDHYLEVGPKLSVEAPLGTGRFRLGYEPVLRSLATYERVNSTTQVASLALELPVADTVTLSAGDQFASGTLDTRLVDPGGEYFFGLGRFHRNDASAGARLALAPRLSLDVSARAGGLRFVEPSTFFDYDSRALTAGVSMELAPSLRSSLSYSYDTIPRPDQRPEAGASAHSASLSFDGDLRPLLSGQLSFGYRRQSNPEAGEGGRSYSGLVAAGTLTQRLGRESAVSFFVSRSTPPSAFQSNGFYVSSALQATAEFPVPLELRLRGGLGWQWNAYRTNAVGLGEPRRDRLLGAFVSLRRALPGRLTLAGTYRTEHRDSNVDRLSTDSSGVLIELEWDALGGKGR